MSSPLADLPLDVLGRVFQFLDVISFVQCAKTCNRLRNATRHDETVKHHPAAAIELESYIVSKHFLLRYSRALELVHQEQRSKSNILIDVMGVEGFRSWAQDMPEFFLQGRVPDLVPGQFPRGGREHSYRPALRGDTADVLTHLIQDNMVEWLKQHFELVVELAGTEFPQLRADIFVRYVYRSMRIPHFLIPEFAGSRSLQDEVAGWLRQYAQQVDEEKQWRILVRLARRAGIPKLADYAYIQLWEFLVAMMIQVLRRALWNHALVQRSRAIPRKPSRFEMRAFNPPLFAPFDARSVQDSTEPDPVGPLFECVLSPGPVETSARELGLPINTVLGENWLVENAAATVKNEMREHWRKYNVAGRDDESEESMEPEVSPDAGDSVNGDGACWDVEYEDESSDTEYEHAVPFDFVLPVEYGFEMSDYTDEFQDESGYEIGDSQDDDEQQATLRGLLQAMTPDDKELDTDDEDAEFKELLGPEMLAALLNGDDDDPMLGPGALHVMPDMPGAGALAARQMDWGNPDAVDRRMVIRVDDLLAGRIPVPEGVNLEQVRRIFGRPAGQPMPHGLIPAYPGQPGLFGNNMNHLGPGAGFQAPMNQGQPGPFGFNMNQHGVGVGFHEEDMDDRDAEMA